MQQLQQGATLQNGKYRIEKVLGQGGFGITYLATQTVLGNKVAIKELFMQGVNDRQDSSVTVSNNANSNLFANQKRKFVKEAQRIAGLDNKHIVKVHDMFEENDTAYYVMDYIEGESLQDVITHHHGALAESSVRDYLNQILSALSAMHQHSIWHLDIKPANIMLDKNGNIVLIDFGASKQIDTSDSNATIATSTSLAFTPGYASPEQMLGSVNKFGPWTDFYSLGGTLYSLLTSKMPPTISDMDEQDGNSFTFPPEIGSRMRELVLWLMKPKIANRPQQVSEIQEYLETGNKVNKDTLPWTNRLSKFVIGMGVVAIIIVWLAVAYFVMHENKQLWACGLVGFIVSLFVAVGTWFVNDGFVKPLEYNVITGVRQIFVAFFCILTTSIMGFFVLPIFDESPVWIFGLKRNVIVAFFTFGFTYVVASIASKWIFDDKKHSTFLDFSGGDNDDIFEKYSKK